MGKYMDTLKNRESLFNETSENYILEDQKENIFSHIPTSTHCQKAQKSHRWQDSTPVCPVALLDKLIESGATISEHNGALRVIGGDIDERTRDAVRDQKDALLALWRFRQYAATRTRFVHWVCPDRHLLALWREGERQTRRALTIAGNLRRENK